MARLNTIALSRLVCEANSIPADSGRKNDPIYLTARITGFSGFRPSGGNESHPVRFEKDALGQIIRDCGVTVAEPSTKVAEPSQNWYLGYVERFPNEHYFRTHNHLPGYANHRYYSKWNESH